MRDLTNVRTRNWVFIMYPDSIPNNDYNKAVLLIQEFHIPFAVSPLHDMDFNADSTPKKPHWHVLLTADGPKSYKQIKEITVAVNGCDCRPCDSAQGYYRYFTHKDNPEKAQYSEVDIKHYCGFDAEIYNKPTSTARYLAVRDMIKFIKDNDIKEYCDFVELCAFANFEWFKLLCDNSSYIVIEYIKSARNKFKDEEKENQLKPKRRDLTNL